ncbi:MAG: hypothetical protein FWE88_09805, partial [Phycisphaerae bacterium]|nr:hypothetical protein [Phycisphaerae bacterium]
MIPLLFAVLAGTAFAVMGLAYKRSAAQGSDPIAFAVAFLAAATAVAMMRAVIWEDTPWADGRLW